MTIRLSRGHRFPTGAPYVSVIASLFGSLGGVASFLMLRVLRCTAFLVPIHKWSVVQLIGMFLSPGGPFEHHLAGKWDPSLNFGSFGH